jgi:phage tail tape-measure protein
MRFAEFMNSAKLPESVMELSKSIDKALNSLVDGVLNGETPEEIKRNTTTAKMAIVEASVRAACNGLEKDAREASKQMDKAWEEEMEYDRKVVE